MKKCYLVSYNGLSNIGGVERVCYYLNKIVCQKGFEVKVVDKLAIENYWISRIITLLTGRVPLLLSCLLSSLYIIQRKRKGDLVITNGFNCPLVHADMLFMHGTMKGHNTAIGLKESFRSNIPILFEKWAVMRAKNLICVSECALEEVRKYYRHKMNNCCVVNNMVDESIYFPIKKSFNNILNIVYCGRVEKRKGMDKLLALTSYIDKNKVPARLLIAANNNLNIAVLSERKCVEIHVGLEHHQLNDFYNKGDVMYFPSMYEGFEMVTLEALSAGVPVLGNHVGAVAEIFDRKEPGVDIISSPENPKKILQQLKQLADYHHVFDKRMMLHNYYAEHYGIDAYMKKLNNVFSQITK